MLSKKALADAIGVARHTVIRWESMDSSERVAMPTSENVAMVARVLGFPSTFFYGEDVDGPMLETTSFRSQTAMTAAQRDAALAAGQLGSMIWDWVNEKFNLPDVNIPDLGANRDPESAAHMLRQVWGLGEKPIANMIQILEAKGVRVLSLVENTLTVNAYSFWQDEIPFVFLNNFKTAECSRFDAAHELGHLILHRDGAVTGRIAEEEANKFASAFLMPHADVVATVPRLASLNQLISLKSRWRVSLAALNYRIHKLGITTDWRYRDLCIEIAKHGYNKAEPEGIERERSILWEKVLRELFKDGMTHEAIAAQLHIPLQEVNDLLFGIIGSATPKDQVREALKIVARTPSKVEPIKPIPLQFTGDLFDVTA